MLGVTMSDDTIWKQVKGWVHGPKAHGLTLREYTDEYAHNACVNKARAGQAADQPSLLDEDYSVITIREKCITVVKTEDDTATELARELFDDKK